MQYYRIFIISHKIREAIEVRRIDAVLTNMLAYAVEGLNHEACKGARKDVTGFITGL